MCKINVITLYKKLLTVYKDKLINVQDSTEQLKISNYRLIV